MKSVFTALALTLLASPAFAQVHPCDTTPLVNPTVQTSTPVGVGFCHPMVDEGGNSTLITSFRVTLDGTTVFTGPLVAVGQPSATGENYYTTPKNITASKGSHVVIAYASNAEGESQPSLSYSFTLKGVPPGRARVITVFK